MELSTEVQLLQAPSFQILETLLYTPESGEVYCLLHRRIHPNTRRAPFSVHNKTSAAMKRCVRLLFDGKSVELQALPFVPWTAPQLQDLEVVLDTQPVCSRDVFLRFKTTHRTTYNEARARASIGGGKAFDVVLYNERGEITETSICNLAVENDAGELVTPPVSCGLLAGVQRSELLVAGTITEGLVLLSDLQAAAKADRRILCFNSARGVFAVKLVEGTTST
ncbi:hypothetical protein SARC_06127 [Sphaeroforma arctica JP610]|uniref:Uncharacterized protein n=1 Tax=Sphaeroforma arctica JP610 TaxID=667725 RepID=A0A0L0FXK0_9EUKA|nr:hypothetical protein SARC_06127 [Sphaeroforma arctica JP610]KNC81552.1 hypothetical protein SARC_06127 [Sphaeroforma arctica JP610]|eukprot:XP_014155454.1 hypothetical protein SARC_06127 [Sphaeroforma arctica JP610]